MRAGDVVTIDFGTPLGSEAGFRRPAVLVTADAVLEAAPRVVHVVPLTSTTTRALPFEVPVEADGLDLPSVAQCHLCTAVSTQRMVEGGGVGNVGPAGLAQIRDLVADLLDIGA